MSLQFPLGVTSLSTRSVPAYASRTTLKRRATAWCAPLAPTTLPLQPYVCPPPPGIWLLSATPSSNIDLRFLGVSFGAYGDGALDAYTNSTANIEAEHTELQKAVGDVRACSLDHRRIYPPHKKT